MQAAGEPGNGAPAASGGPAPAHVARPGQPHSRKARAWKRRGGGKPANAGAPRPPHGADVRRTPGKPHPSGQRPRGRRDFDEVQPVSNANAAPFGRTTLTVPGGTAGNFDKRKQGPRHRSGPRARTGGGNGHPRNQGASQPLDRRELSEPAYKAPSRPVTQTQIRSKRTRTIVAADVAADVNETPALRRLLNDKS